MEELLPPEFPLDAPTTTTNAAAAAAAIITPSILLPASVDTTTNNNNLLGGQKSLAPKRQRRPSVRLGEIGDQPATLSHAPRRSNKPWRSYKHPALLLPSNKSSSKTTTTTHPLTNLVLNNGLQILDAAADVNLDFGNRKPKSKRATTTKRVRTNWTTSNNDYGRIEGENDKEELVRDFELEIEEGSESPAKEQSPVQSVDNAGLDYWGRNNGRVRVSESRDRESEETSGDKNFGSGSERGRNRNRNQNNGFLDDGVRNWLIGLGLGRYAAVFEIHEVDDQVLPLLTLEDLKDMGINAVGSRRKLYSAILKLPKGIS